MYQVASRLELNALDWNAALPRVSEFAFKNRCPAIVTLPQLIPAFIADRDTKQGVYRVIAAVDFSNQGFAMQKVRDMGGDATAADGFDIMISSGRPANEIFNEVKSVSDFLRSINPLAEIRWVLGAFTRPDADINNYFKCFAKYQVNWLRLDPQVASPRITAGHQIGMVDSLRRGTKLPIKISGNVTKEVVDHFMKDKGIRFDVTLEQATALLAAYEAPAVEPKKEEKKEEPKKVAPPVTELEGEHVTGTIGHDV